MTKTAIVYWSGTGNTAAMAHFVAEGAKSAGADVSVFTADEFSADKINDFDSLAFGCPSMGCEQLEESEFEPLFDSCKSSLKGKNVALFGSYGWGRRVDAYLGGRLQIFRRKSCLRQRNLQRRS